MAAHTKQQVLALCEQAPIIPVFYNANVESAWAVMQACFAGGVRAFEFTNRGDFAHEIFSELAKRVRKHIPELALGAGTILDGASATLFLQSGADFIVSPFFSEEVARTCNRRAVLYAPGCLTLKEIATAQEMGADLVKVFPGSAFGPSYVKAILGPMPWSRIMPTGGVEPTEASISAWFKAGVTCVGMGSQLFPAKLDEAGIAELTQRCREALRYANQAR